MESLKCCGNCIHSEIDNNIIVCTIYNIPLSILPDWVCKNWAYGLPKNKERKNETYI